MMSGWSMILGVGTGCCDLLFFARGISDVCLGEHGMEQDERKAK